MNEGNQTLMDGKVIRMYMAVPSAEATFSTLVDLTILASKSSLYSTVGDLSSRMLVSNPLVWLMDEMSRVGIEREDLDAYRDLINVHDFALVVDFLRDLVQLSCITNGINKYLATWMHHEGKQWHLAAYGLFLQYYDENINPNGRTALTNAFVERRQSTESYLDVPIHVPAGTADPNSGLGIAGETNIPVKPDKGPLVGFTPLDP